MPARIHSWHLYGPPVPLACLNGDPAEGISEMERAGIGTSVHWMPLHLHPYYRETFGCEPLDYPFAAAIYPELMTLPLYPDLTEDEVTYVCRTLKEIIARSRVTVGALAFPQQRNASRHCQGTS